jgi:cytochrome P450
MPDALRSVQRTDVASLPPVPRNPLSWSAQLQALRGYHTGSEILRDAGGPVTRLTLAPKWLMPRVVLVTSPRGGHDTLGRPDAVMERVPSHTEMRRLIGNNLFDVPHDAWVPLRRALQPVFTKKHVAAYAGHMANAAETVVGGWRDGEYVDLDVQCRTLTLRALGRSCSEWTSISGPTASPTR